MILANLRYVLITNKVHIHLVLGHNLPFIRDMLLFCHLMAAASPKQHLSTLPRESSSTAFYSHKLQVAIRSRSKIHPGDVSTCTRVQFLLKDCQTSSSPKGEGAVRVRNYQQRLDVNVIVYSASMPNRGRMKL